MSQMSLQIKSLEAKLNDAEVRDAQNQGKISHFQNEIQTSMLKGSTARGATNENLNPSNFEMF